MKEKEFKKLETIFYRMAAVAGERLPDTPETEDEDQDFPDLKEWVKEEWRTYRESLKAFRSAFKALNEGEMEVAFYKMAALAGEYLPNEETDPEFDDLIRNTDPETLDQWRRYSEALKSFQSTARALRGTL